MRKFNWPLWTGFCLALISFVSYFTVFAIFPITRDVPWANFILFVIAVALLVAGVRRASRKVVPSIVAGLGAAVLVFFVFVVVDTPEQSAQLRRKAGYTFPFLSDPRAEVVRRYDLLHKGGGEKGQDIARPAEFLVDRSGTVRWVNLAGDFRVRARPEEMIAAAKALR